MMESQPLSSASDAMSTFQQLSFDAQRLNLESKGSIINLAPSNSAGNAALTLWRTCANQFAGQFQSSLSRVSAQFP